MTYLKIVRVFVLAASFCSLAINAQLAVAQSGQTDLVNKIRAELADSVPVAQIVDEQIASGLDAEMALSVLRGYLNEVTASSAASALQTKGMSQEEVAEILAMAVRFTSPTRKVEDLKIRGISNQQAVRYLVVVLAAGNMADRLELLMTMGMDLRSAAETLVYLTVEPDPSALVTVLASVGMDMQQAQTRVGELQSQVALSDAPTQVNVEQLTNPVGAGTLTGGGSVSTSR
jgi:hypothetical protein